MHISKDGIELIKSFEGCKLDAYLNSVQVPTIGYGHTAGVCLGDSITQDQADQMLAEDLEKFEGYVATYVTVPLSQHQFDALVSFTYNLGPGTLSKSTLLKQLNAGDYDAAAQSILLFDHAGGVKLRGLTRRRLAENALFTKPDEPNIMDKIGHMFGRKA